MDFGSNSKRKEEMSPEQKMAQETITNVFSGKSWWERNVVDNLRAADAWLMGDGEQADWIHGNRLTWEGHGDQGPAIRSDNAGETIDITDLMEAFGVLGKSMNVSPSSLKTFLDDPSNMKKFRDAAKDTKAFAELVFENIPEAWDKTEKELGMLPIAPGLRQALIEERRARLGKDGAAKGSGVVDGALDGAKDQLDKEEQPATVEGPASSGSGGSSSGGYGTSSSGSSSSSTSEGTGGSQEGSGGVVAGPGQVLVTRDSGKQLAVPAWQLPVKRWEGRGGMNYYLMEKYADGSYRTYIDSRGRNLGFVQCDSTEVAKGDWTRLHTRDKLPDGSWSDAWGGGAHLRKKR